MDEELLRLARLKEAVDRVGRDDFAVSQELRGKMREERKAGAHRVAAGREMKRKARARGTKEPLFRRERKEVDEGPSGMDLISLHYDRDSDQDEAGNG